MNGADRPGEIRRLFPLVRQIARRVHRVLGAADFDDLVGDGSIGLIRAVDTFDPKRGTSLETYARKVIAGAMLNGLRRLDTVSERARRTLRRAEAERYRLAQERGAFPTMAEMEAREGGLRRARAAAHRQAALSLDAPLPGGNRVPPDCAADPAQTVLARAKRREIAESLALLPERQRRILALHYDQALSLHAISARLRVSPQRVSQLHLSALARLRSALPAP